MTPIRSNRWQALALSALLAIGAAHAQDKKDEALRPEVAKPLQAAQEAIKAGRSGDAMARVKEAEAVANRSPYEVFITDRMKGTAAMQLNDPATAARAFEAVIATGRLSGADQLWVLQALAALTLRNGQPQAAAGWARRYFSEGGTDAKLRLTLVQALYAANEHAAAAKEVLPLIQADEAAGRTPAEDQLKLLAVCQLKLGDEAGYAQTLERLVTHHPRPEYWSDLVARIQARNGFADRLLLDAFRLTRRAGRLEDDGEYQEMAQLALQAGLPGEALSVVEEGFAKGVLGKGPNADKHQRLRASAAKAAKDDQAQLAASEASARKARDGAALVSLGMAVASYGDAARGLSLMAEGQAKGVQKQPDDARLHLGVALLAAGRRTDAEAQLKAVTATDGTADLARLWLLVR